MQKYRYSEKLSSGTVALAGTLAALIPPSILIVIYGVETETSVGKLLLAGLLPGILMTFLYCIAIWIITKINPEEAPTIDPASWKDRFLAIKTLWPIVILGLLVLGAIYTGLATPTEAAAIGAVGTAILGAVTGCLNPRNIMIALKRTLNIVGMIFAIIIGATIFAYFLTSTGTPQAVISTIGALAVPRWVILLAAIGLYILLGMFLDAIGCMLLTIPLVFPLIVNLGYDPIWFGVILVMILEIGFVTPPVGINCFIASGTSGIPLNTVFRGGLRLLVASFIGLALLVMFPEIALFIPIHYEVTEMNVAFSETIPKAKALEGLRVIEIGSLVGGPFCGTLMAEFGAEVIKVEDPGTGDPARYLGKNIGETSWVSPRWLATKSASL